MEIELFQDGGQIKIKMNIDHHMGAKIQAFDIFQTPLSSHYPLPLSNLLSYCLMIETNFDNCVGPLHCVCRTKIL